MSNTQTRQGGPPLLIPAIVMAVFTAASAALGATAARYNSANLLTYTQTHQTTQLILGTLVFGIALPLLIWSATVYKRLHRLGVTAPGTAIAYGGGLLAAASLALSGLLTWTTTQVTGSADLVKALTALGFTAGGPGFVVPFAMLIAGVAVPGLILKLLPTALAWTGLIIAGLGALATFALLTPALDVLLPIGRFGGLIWLIAVSVALPVTRPRRAQQLVNA
ncbi:MAG TPA: DUF4386 domain-containing protein [Pseudonocardiaceae bacterium]|nr:DUF4386 domain-containing protein [Pseudonocardiaceae bacterium]